MSNKVILSVIASAVGIGLLVLINIFRDGGPNNISKQTPAPSEVFISSPSPSASPRPSPSPKQIAASCQITGQIVFLDKNLYENKNAKIIYQNVDDAIRQIYWKSNPDDGVLTVGPNLFEDLPLPSGERNVGVAVNRETTVKNYTLTASINYGIKNTNGIVEERIANCVGKASVQMP